MTASALTIELLSQQEQTAFNLRRWEELVADPELTKIEGRIETDRHGHILMSPPAFANHGRRQFLIAKLLDALLEHGTVLTECPISTADGVRAADVAWASPETIQALGHHACFPKAPEICVEVISPGNTEAEMKEKKALYFDADASEVWFCSESGAMTFYFAQDQTSSQRSGLCPTFPPQVELT